MFIAGCASGTNVPAGGGASAALPLAGAATPGVTPVSSATLGPVASVTPLPLTPGQPLPVVLTPQCATNDGPFYDVEHWLRAAAFVPSTGAPQAAVVAGNLDAIERVTGDFSQPATLQATAVANAFGPTCWSNDVTFVNAALGYAVGWHGLMQSTRDGGATWSLVNYQSGYDIYQLAAPTSSDFVAVGNAGVIFQSTDGGTSWSVRVGSSPSQAYLHGLAFLPSSRTGYAVGQCGAIVSTSDGGASWTKPVPFTQCGPPHYPFLLGIAFNATGTLGAAVGDHGNLLLSRDAGATWTQALLPPLSATPAFYGVAFLPSGTIVVAGQLHSPVEDDNTYCGVVLRSTDNGNTWTAATKTDQGVPLFGLLALAFATQSSLPQSGLAAGLHGTIYASADEGQTWHAVSPNPFLEAGTCG